MENLKNIKGSSINPQDLCVMSLLKEGLTYSEISKLRRSDVDSFGNVLFFDNRRKTVSEFTINALKEAIHQKYYLPNNGFFDEEPVELFGNDYIIRSEHGSMTDVEIKERTEHIKKLIDEAIK